MYKILNFLDFLARDITTPARPVKITHSSFQEKNVNKMKHLKNIKAQVGKLNCRGCLIISFAQLL
jgi:hypothetical protein